MTELTSEQCLQLLLRGANELRRGNLAVADNLISSVILAARALPKEQAYAIFPLATADLSLVRARQGKTAEAAKLRALAITTIDVIAKPPEHAGYLSLLADALADLGEHRRAIPFYESAAQRMCNNGDSLNTAVLLSRAGQCYTRAGLHAQAVVPLRASLDLFRHHAADPRTPEVLLNLGNALRKTSPAEAEEAYKEAAAWYESRLQLESAAPAWVNLGILCSENHRHDEALAWYRKALDARERSPRTPPLRLASLYNNIANCYRRMGQFTEAHNQIGRAIKLLESAGTEDRLVAAAYHSRALIFAAEDRDLEALEWLHKADACRQKLPNPSLEETATDLTELIAVLDRLHRTDEADATRKRLESTRAAQASAAAAQFDLSGLDSEAEGALLIEIPSPTTPLADFGNQVSALGFRLGEQVASEDTGYYTGSVTIPEAVTLIFRAPDAEALYRTLEPILRTEPLTRAAHITLIQGATKREVTLSAN